MRQPLAVHGPKKSKTENVNEGMTTVDIIVMHDIASAKEPACNSLYMAVGLQTPAEESVSARRGLVWDRSFRHGVRALISRTSRPETVPPGQADELACLREQLAAQTRRHTLETKQMLQNQALAIETFQHKGQLAGQKAQSFAQRTRNNSEDFVRCELAVQRFELSLQKKHDTQLHTRMHAPR